VKIMYKETAKSEKKPIGLALLWIAFIYAFYIIWGITEILIEVKAPFYIKHIILFGLTTWFIWKIIKRYITEYEYAANKTEFTATRKLGRKQKLMFTIKYKNIEAMYNNDEKEKVKNHNVNKKIDITKAHQLGNTVHIVYKFNNKLNLVSLTASRKMLKLIKDYIETEEKNI